MKNKNLIAYFKDKKDKIEKVKTQDGQNEFKKVYSEKIELVDLKEKLVHLYEKIIDNIPKEKNDEIKQLIVSTLKLGEDYFNSSKNKNSSIKEIAKHIQRTTMLEHIEELISGAENLIEDDRIIENIVAEEKNYQPMSTTNIPQFPLKEVVKKIENGEKFKSLDKNKKDEVSKQLEEISEIVVQSSEKYSSRQQMLDSDYETIRNRKTREQVSSKLKGEYSYFDKVYTYDRNTLFLKDDITDNQEKIDTINSLQFNLDDDAKQKIFRIWKKMDELNIVESGNGGEDGSKVYGFKKLLDARKNLNTVLEKEDFEKLAEVKDEYNKQLENMREMYKIVKEELDPAPEKMPGNQENVRNASIPAEFKNDLPLNSAYNGIYCVYSLLKYSGYTAEQFLENPNKCIGEITKYEMERYEIDHYHTDATYEEKLAYSYGDNTLKVYNIHGIGRALGNLNLFVTDPKIKFENELYRSTIVGKVDFLTTDDLLANNYFNKDRTGTLANNLLARSEDRNFMNLHSYDSTTPDRLHSVKAFDRAKYIKEKNILPNEFADRITTFVAEAYKISEEDNERYRMELAEYEIANDKFKIGKGDMPIPPEKPKLTKKMFVREIKDVQVAIQQYLLLKDPLENDGVERLKNILKDPIIAFESMNICPEYKKAMAELKNKNKTFETAKKEIQRNGEQIIKDTRTAEKNYNRRIDAILKSTNILSAKLKGETDSKRVSDIQVELAKKMNEMKLLQKEETERLKGEFKAGRLPKNYCEERIANIIALKHNEKVALFTDGFDKEKFIKSTGLTELSKEEREGICLSEIERRKVEKEELYNKLYLIQKGSILNSEVGDIKVNASFNTVDVEGLNVSRVSDKDIQREPIVVDEANIKIELNKSIDSSSSVEKLDEKENYIERDSVSISSK